jgi:hypothetical protein
MGGRRKGGTQPLDRKLRLALLQAMRNEGIASYADLVVKMGDWAKVAKIAGFEPPHQTSVRRVLEPDPDGDDVETRCSYLHVLRGTLGVLENTDFEVSFNRADIKVVRILAQLRSLNSVMVADVVAAAEKALAATLDAHRKQLAEAQKMLTPEAPEERPSRHKAHGAREGR